jgi:hypothetical protein
MRQGTLQIIIQHLGRELAEGEGRSCLDLDTGKLVPWESVAGRSDAGEGRPALQQGKRFVHVPALDELFAEWKKQREDVEAEKDWEFAGRCKRLSWSQKRDFLGFSDHLRNEQVGANMALRWIKSLRPSFPVEMVDEMVEDEPDDPVEGYVYFRYDPASGCWSEV